MRWASALFASIVLAACGGSSTASVAGASPSATTNAARSAALAVDGETRTYLLFRPHQLSPTQRVPLVIALHGFTQSAELLEASTHFDLEATRVGFVVVYPNGIDRSWNAGSCCGNAVSQSVDDVAFIRRLIDSLVAGAGIDSKRVFVTGLSNGGMMAHRLACELSDRVSAVASVSGASLTDTCHPGRPVSVLEMHGTADGLVPYDGGTTGPVQFPSTMSFMTRWARLDGCAADPAVNESGVTKTYAWGSCREGASVVLDAIIGAGHSWFAPPAEPDATQVVWDFFSRVPVV